MMIRGQNAKGEIVEHEVTPLSSEEIARRQAIRDAKRPKPPLPGLAFLARLTDAEYGAILNAAASQLAAGQPQLSRWIDMLRLSGEIDVAGDTALEAKSVLVLAGLLTPDRAALIFAQPE